MTFDPYLQPPEFRSRKEFMEYVGEMMTVSPEERRAMAEYGEETRGRPPELKTYIMESNNGLPRIHEANTIEVSHASTSLPQISVLRLRYNNLSTTFYVDASDPRFLLLYTNDLADIADGHYDRLVLSSSNSFDKVWLPTEVLDRISQLSGNVFRGFGLQFDDLFAPERTEEEPVHELSMSVTGTSSAEALDALSEREALRRSLSYSKIRTRRGNIESSVTDEIRYNGRIITRAGDSIDDHVSLAEAIRRIYKNLIEAIEMNSIGTRRVEDRTLIEGQAFDLVLDRQIEDLDHFLDVLLSSTFPFRLWGLRSRVFSRMRKVVAVDLHTGDPLDLEITPSLIRIYLPKGACGNTVLRMYVNLQHSFDSAIRFNGEKLPQTI